MNREKPLLIGLAGFGVVGGGLCQLLQDNADIIERRAGRPIRVKTVLVRDAAKKRAVALPKDARLVIDPAELIDDEGIEAIVELMGGIETPRALIQKALERGKHVVTANKALLAQDGIAMLKKAAATRSILRYEASVAGAIPVVAALKESLNGNRVNSLVGILNGTSNYILSEMTAKGVEFAQALAKAQELGFAEADPSLDIDGMDAAHKLVVLIRLAFGLDYPLDKLSVEGIRDLSSLDIRLAGEFGYNIKLLGQVKAMPDPVKPDKIRLAAGVFPALVQHSLLLARVNGAYNALRVGANAAGPLFFHGKGAGALPTAGAVLADLVAVARGESPNNSGFADCDWPKAPILPNDEWSSAHYARVMVPDAPGVLRDISGCLAAEGVSVAQMIQKSEESTGGVPLVFITHECPSRAISDALSRAAKAGYLRAKAVCYRIIEREKAF